MSSATMRLTYILTFFLIILLSFFFWLQLQRHAHLVAFENSDLLFVCMLKPLSFEITIDEKEIQAAKVLKKYSQIVTSYFFHHTLLVMFRNSIYEEKN